MFLSLILGLFHFAVDAATVTVVFRAVDLHEVSPLAAFVIVVGYDLLAFASQAAFGWFVDQWSTPRAALLAGLALTLAATGAYSASPIAAMLLAGLGNALFHIGAGAAVLRLGLKKALPSGLFVAPGALGLGFGMYYGKAAFAGPVWPLAVMIAAAIIPSLLIKIPPPLVASNPYTEEEKRLARFALIFLLASIFIRSIVGMSAARGFEKTTLLLFGLPIASFIGKAVGGFIADRFGWIETGVGVLLASAPFIVFNSDNPILLLIGLALFQMTMPVTLVAAALTMPTRLATAFGWTCFALIVGAIPTFFPWGDPLCGKSVLLGWIVLAAAAIFIGLKSLGIDGDSETASLLQNATG